MEKRLLQGFLVSLMMLGFGTIAFADMAGEHYRIPSSVLSGGGASMTSAHYRTTVTLGQPTPWMDQADALRSASYDLYPGFWYTLEAVRRGAMPWLMLLLEDD